ncbi:hypothetical protein [Cryobacterium gelidum]|uniref:Uncharacterized protein n=1 Tax=Cryobacterium gelidum TaxID=1259164 RepID=A0A4R9AQT0_9MICO|nr:hypothetical protein [Cryobacterium gelidum]TFD68180.1 hypothetical protein E3T50_13445 [Cryobacterium gelidum]
MSEILPSAVPGILSEMFAVVLYGDHGAGVSLRWNSADRTWLRSSPYGTGFVAQDPPHKTGSGEWAILTSVDAPSVEDLAVSVELAETLKRTGYCQFCRQGALSLHAILPDIYGDPMIACVLRPNPAIVDSSGGTGRTKHWGASSACNAVRATPIFRPNSYVEVGVYLYGEPLTILDAIDRPWCTKCSGAAHIVRVNLSEALGREVDAIGLSDALQDNEDRRAQGDKIRYLLDEVGDRNRQELLMEMRAGMRGLTAEIYAAKDEN